MFEIIEKQKIVNSDLIRFISKNTLDPLFLLPEIQRRKVKPFWQYLKNSIYNLPKELIIKTTNIPLFRHISNPKNSLGIEFEAGIYILTKYLQKKIPPRRCKELTPIFMHNYEC